jgi:outer membrane lipoprotein-sorting protein
MALPRVAPVVALLCSVLVLTSCLARRRVITRNKTAPNQSLKTSNQALLLGLVRTEYESIQALNATVDMVPAVGSVNKGKITEYKDVRAYILFKKPAEIRLIGLYPVVRNKAFDMVSNGTDFRLFVPSKNQFIVGRNEPGATPSPKKIENLRPSVFLDALLIKPPGPKEFPVLEDFTDEDNAVYILHVLDYDPDGQVHLARNIWFSRITLNIIRQVIFDSKGNILTDARYSDWKTYDGVPFARIIDINRPQDEYGVVITVVKADINKPINDSKFVLEQPEGTVLQVLDGKAVPAAAPPAEASSASRKKKTAE